MYNIRNNRFIRKALAFSQASLFAVTALLTLSPYPVSADELVPDTLLDQVKQRRAERLDQEMTSGVLPQADVRRILGLASRERQRAPISINELSNNHFVGACFCQAICQTITLWTADQFFQGSGEVTSPSACADAATKYCGAAYSTWLNSWSCQPL